MKILALMTADFMRLSFAWALESLGHQVYHLNRIHEKELQMIIKTFDPELYVDMGWDKFQLEDLDILTTILKKHKVYHLYFAEEDYLFFEKWSKYYVSKTLPEFVLTRSKECVSKYQDMGLIAEYLDVGCIPEFQRPRKPNHNFLSDVSLIARPHFWYDTYRKKSISDLVLPLIDLSHEIKIWGTGWEDTEKYFGKSFPKRMLPGAVSFHKTPEVYSSTKINISLQSVQDQVSNRTYDILTSGGFLLTSDTQGVREKLKPGIHCEVSNSPEETVEKIEYYLKHEDLRQQIARQGHLYASEKFAYKNTIPIVWPQIERAVRVHQKKIGK